MGSFNDNTFFESIVLIAVSITLVQLLFLALGMLIGVIIEYVGNINYLNFLTPFRYFIGTDVVNKGISIIYVLIGALVTFVSIYLTYVLYNKRDLLY
ncbi:hypothetical protein [Sedimentibacter acidaminivorans]|nr:hypothetical protein [Sedimentibacter acidaminivorans]